MDVYSLGCTAIPHSPPGACSATSVAGVPILVLSGSRGRYLGLLGSTWTRRTSLSTYPLEGNPRSQLSPQRQPLAGSCVSFAQRRARLRLWSLLLLHSLSKALGRPGPAPPPHCPL